MVSYNRLHEIQDLNDQPIFQFDYRQEIIAMTNSQAIPIITSTFPNHKDIDNYYQPRIQTFTEYLSDPSENYITEITELEFLPQPNTTEIFSMDDTKIKMEYGCPLSPLDSIYMSRTISQGSSSDLSVCNSSSMPLTPPQPSPHQLHSHLPEHIISRGRNSRMTTISSSPTMQEMIPEQPQEFRRRMTNKPSKPGTKSFECTYEGCGRIFKRSEHLKRHIRSIHTLERPFHCPFPHCTKRFSRSDNLSQHVRVHRPNGKEKNASTRAFNNFTPYLQTYQAGGSIHTTLQHN
ncbi:7493_t:CDS:2 [Diversispora eburnea]|uniref:7493_t:CDS:1 n=1 Tax=Diversispora eburnea TaxID=1213867 RepID=A0A9N8YMN0_9GLOM|nr:7493_t:CDS:2 [Diversispora eburnea]